jgi:Bacterial antitoxin of type II TA system, VapB
VPISVSHGVNLSAAKLPFVVYWEYDFEYNGIMKTTVNIPDSDLEDAIRFTKAKTKREAIVTAIQEFNRRRRMAELTKHAGTCKNLLSVEELLQQRRKG